MEIPFTFEPLLLFGFLSIMLLIGVVLRAKIHFFQKFLFPSCIIGGILGLILINIRVINFSASQLVTFAYHFFNISFISVGLTPSNNRQENIEHGKDFFKGPLWMTLVHGVTFTLQAVIGGLFIIIFRIFGLKLFPTFGFLAPLGFTEGPGQALSIGKVWEGFGFEHGGTIGLVFATIGFFFAFFIGIPLVNWGVRNGYSTYTPKTLPQDFLTGIIRKNQKKGVAGALTTHSGNIDTLALQAALVGLVYVLTYAFVGSFERFFTPDKAKILWGFFFIFGLGMAFIIRLLMKKFGVGHLIDPGIQRRITGWAVDYLIVSTVAAIQILILWRYMLPILIIAFVTGLLTTLIVVYLGRRIWSYNMERMVFIYGTVTGTVSCGLLLLRVIDPDFKSPVPFEIAVMNVFSVPIIGSCTVLLNAPLWWDWSVALTVLVFISIMIVCLGAIRIFKLWGPAKF